MSKTTRQPAAVALLAVGTLLAAAALLALVLPSNAHAQTSYGHVGEFGGAGSDPGQFAQNPGPGRIAVHEASGRIFVADTGNDRIQVFDPVADEEDPAFPAEVVEGEEITGAFTRPVGVAIDQVTADLYVTAAASQEIAKFNADTAGTPADYSLDTSFESPPQGSDSESGEIGSFGQLAAFTGLPHRGAIAVDNSSGLGQGEILLADWGHGLIQRYGPDGWDSGAGFLGNFDGSDSGTSFDNLFDLAVDSAGEVVVADAQGGSGIRIERFEASGDHLASIHSWAVSFPETMGAVVSVNAETGEILVGRNHIEGSSDTETWILQFADDELHDEIEYPGGRDQGASLGIAVRAELPRRLYPLASEGMGAPSWVQVYDQADPPVCESIEVSDVTTDSATFTGWVNPLDDSGSYRFEYREAGDENWQRIPVPNGALQGGTEPEPVGPHTAEGLEPATEHEVRLRAFNPAECLEHPTDTFTTEPVAPVAETGEAHSISAFRASLGATVNPRNSETTYVFEYGTDQSYGQVTEAASGGDGREPTEVFAEVEGLAPSTTYHFRVIATNAEFPERELRDTGDNATFQTRPAAHSALPERAYELVSRLDTDGIPSWGMKAADSGDAYSYYTLLPVPGAENGGQTFLRMARDPDQGWSADPHMLTPPVDPDHPDLGVSLAPLVSNDLSLSVFRTIGSYHPMDQNRDGGDTGRDFYLRSTETGELTWLSRDPHDDGPQTDPANAQTQMYLSPDADIAIFLSDRRLLDSHDSGSALYKWHSGELTHVSLDPGGENVSGASVGSRSHTRNAVSPDGSRVVFDGGPLYVRIDDEQTVAVEGGDDPGGGSAGYWGADAETTEIVYARGGSLYLFDVFEEESTMIAPQVSAEPVLAVSDDTDRIYFNSPAELTPDAEGGDRYLYLAERSGGQEHEIRLVSEIHPDDRLFRGGAQPATYNNQDANSDGSILAFTSLAELLPGRKNGGFPQVYVYEAEVDRLYCASCPPDGSLPEGRGDIGAKSARDGGALPPTGGWRLDFFSNERLPAWTNVSESGSVFFQSNSQLLPGVSNHAFDTYEWRGGELRLISSGQGSRNQFFADASVNGETVFFQSGSDMATHDGVSGETRIYAARVGGGFVPPEPEAECEGSECQGPASSAPEADRPASADARPGDPPEARISAERLNRKQARRLARGKRIALGVEVSGPGRVAAVVRARLRGGGKMVRVGRAATRVREAGEAAVRGLRLNRRGMRALRRQGRLTVRIVARYRGETAGQRVRLGNRNRLQRRAQRLRARARDQAERGNRARAANLRQRARRLHRQSRRLNRSIASAERGQG